MTNARDDMKMTKFRQGSELIWLDMSESMMKPGYKSITSEEVEFEGVKKMYNLVSSA